MCGRMFEETEYVVQVLEKAKVKCKMYLLFGTVNGRISAGSTGQTEDGVAAMVCEWWRRKVDD